MSKYFQFKEAHERICVECYEFVGKLQYFAERFEKANTLFNRIVLSSINEQNDNNYLQSLRYEAGLDEEKVRKTRFIRFYGYQESNDFSFTRNSWLSKQISRA